MVGIRFSVTLALLGLASAASAAPVNPDYPDYSWQFDQSAGTTAVASNGGVNGTLENSAAFSTDTPFAYAGNHSVDLTGGAGKNVNLTADAGFTYVNTSFTVSLWVKVPASTARMMVVNKSDYGLGNGASTWAYDLEIESSTSNLVGAPLNGLNSHRFEVQTSGTLVDSGTWRHAAVIINTSGSGDVRLFLDGAELTTSISTNNFNGGLYTGAPTIPLRLGSRSVNGGADAATSLDGKVDELALFNRALSSDEILWLSQNSISTIPEPASLMLLTLGGAATLRRRRK